jgi:hypothetical protein
VEDVDVYGFLFHELGIRFKAPPRAEQPKTRP